MLSVVGRGEVTDRAWAVIEPLLPLLDGIAVPRVGPGRARCRPEVVIADKAYAHPSTRAALRRRRIRFTCPEHANQIAHRTALGSRGGRPPAFDPEVYKQRNVVEPTFPQPNSGDTSNALKCRRECVHNSGSWIH